MCNAVNSTRDRRTRKRTRTLRLHISRRYYRPRCRVYFFFPPSLPPSHLPTTPPPPFPLPSPLLSPPPLCSTSIRFMASIGKRGRDLGSNLRASFSRIGRITEDRSCDRRLTYLKRTATLEPRNGITVCCFSLLCESVQSR